MIQKQIKGIIKKLTLRYLEYTDIKQLMEDRYNLKIVWNEWNYNEDGLATMRSTDFIKDEKFNRAYQLAWATGSWQNHLHWRVYIICWAANQVKNLEGDYVECGVNKGGFSRAATNYINFGTLSKTFYLFDTYNGFVKEYIKQEESHNIDGYDYSECYQEVINTFKDYKNVVLVRGPVPDTLNTVEIHKVCYLSIDMNCVHPEIESVKYFWDKIVKNGIIILDDYGFVNHSAQKREFDIFAKEKKVEILALPTGQGIIIKP